MTRLCIGLLGLLLTLVPAGCGSEQPTRQIDFLPLQSIDIASQNPQAAPGTTNRFTATGHFGDPTTFQYTKDITSQVTWSSADTSLLTFRSDPALSGLADALAAGTTTVTATLDAVSSNVSFTVPNASITDLTITPPSSTSLYAGNTLQLQATGTFSDGSATFTQDLTESATWSSSDTGIATVGDTVPGKGLVSAVAVGNVNITADFDGTPGTLALTVAAATLDSIAVKAEGSSTLAVGTTSQLTATGHYSDGTSVDLTDQVTWTVDDQNVATIDTTVGTHGLLGALLAGTVTVTATLQSVSGTLPITVTNATLSSLAIDQSSPTVAVGEVLTLTTTGTFSDNTTQDLTRDVLWSSDDTTVATVATSTGSEGIVKGITSGTANITASSNAVPTTSGAAITTSVSVTVQ